MEKFVGQDGILPPIVKSASVPVIWTNPCSA
jgi:hypothetical protein